MFIVHTESSLGWGGQEIRILTEAQGMIAREHRVEIWAPPESNIAVEAQRRNIPYRALPIARRNPRAFLAMRAALAAARADVVNTHSSTDSWLVALARLTLRAAPPIVRTRHISAPLSNDFATRWLYNHATRHVVTTGERFRQELIERNRLRAGRVTSIPTGIEAGRFHPGDRVDARRALGIDPIGRYVGIVATLRSWKGHLYLLDAFAGLVKDDTALRLLIVGDGPMHSVIEERIAALGLQSKVVLAGRQEAVERWFQAMDVFCMPSYANEGVPQAIVQAMLTALPIVSTSAGSIAEAITDGRTGVIVPPRDVEALTRALQHLLSDRMHAAQLGVAAREEALLRFSFTSMLVAMETVFRDVGERHAKRIRGPRARWQRLRRSIDRRWREATLPRGYVRLGTRYGGWWIDQKALAASPLLIDCGLGRDISFSTAFLSRFGGSVVGIDPNPQSLAYCRAHSPPGMHVVDKAFWTSSGQTLTFNMPREQQHLPAGADGISGSLVASHAYVEGGERLTVTTIGLKDILTQARREECDVLKLDVEGAEYDVLKSLSASGDLSKTKQLLVEFHHGATHYTAADTEATVALVKRAGFRLIHVEGRNHIFRRSDFG